MTKIDYISHLKKSFILKAVFIIGLGVFLNLEAVLLLLIALATVKLSQIGWF